jgi:Cu-processing system permease protein
VSPRSVFHIAADVIREALFSRYLMVLFGLIAVGLLGLAFSLDLEVVDGAIAGSKLFGGNISDGHPMMASEFLRPVFQALAYITFYFGLTLMIIAVADIAPKMFAPGRVELLLSLPLRRVEIVLGTYLGVLIIAVGATIFAIGGASVVLFAKTGLTTLAPVAGAATAFVAFMTCYAAMLLVATIARSAALSAGVGFGLLIAGVATSDRAFMLTLIRSGTTRELVAIVIGPLPRFRTLAEFGADYALGTKLDMAQVLPVVGGCFAIVGFAVVVACAVVHMKDY